MAARLLADDFVRRYWNLYASAAAPPAAISCNRYLINVASANTSDFAVRIREMQAGIANVMSRAQTYSRSHSDLEVRSAAFGRTRVGKGAPEDMEHVLNAGVTCGALPSAQLQLQQWADRHLGCDCTGFASAYFSYLGVMPVADSVNAGCHYFRTLAIRNNTASNAFVWDFDDVSADDVMLWMDESGSETKHPGHIAVIYDKRPGQLLIAESSGADDGAGHRGPHLNTKPWAEATGPRGHRKLPIGEGVIIVRVKRITPAAGPLPT